MPSCVWCVLSDGTAAVITEAPGGIAWSRVSAGGGKILDTVSVPVNGQTAFRLVVKQNERGTQIIGIPEEEGKAGDIFLDEWRVYYSGSLAQQYTAEAFVYDAETDELIPITEQPTPAMSRYIGYLYLSKVRSLPALISALMKPVRIARLKMRFVDSHKPKIAGYPTGVENQIVHPGQIDGGRSGIWNVPVPGNVELDAGFEVYTKHPDSLSLLAWDTEEEA